MPRGSSGKHRRHARILHPARRRGPCLQETRCGVFVIQGRPGMTLPVASPRGGRAVHGGSGNVFASGAKRRRWIEVGMGTLDWPGWSWGCLKRRVCPGGPRPTAASGFDQGSSATVGLRVDRQTTGGEPPRESRVMVPRSPRDSNAKRLLFGPPAACRALRMMCRPVMSQTSTVVVHAARGEQPAVARSHTARTSASCPRSTHSAKRLRRQSHT